MENPAEQALENIEAAAELLMAGDYAGAIEPAVAADEILEAELRRRGEDAVLDTDAKEGAAVVRSVEETADIEDPETVLRERALKARRGETYDVHAAAIEALDRAWRGYRRLTGNYPLLPGKSWREITGDG